MSKKKSSGVHQLMLVDRVYEYHYLRGILEKVLQKDSKMKSDDLILNLCLLSLMLDFGLYDDHFIKLNLPKMTSIVFL